MQWFYAQSPPAEAAAATTTTAMEDDQETDVNASLVEESSATPACAEPSDLVDAVRRLATDASAFFSQVAAWRRIPAVVARIVVSDDDALLPTDGVRRWIAAELRRLQTEADDGDLVDEELVDYTLGLLEHPEFAHPDLVVLELQEFLGREAATSFVLSLWRFLVMEIGLRHVHKTAAPPSTTSAAPPAASSIQMARRSTANSSAASTPPPLQSQAPDYKRRRPSYRRKGSSHHNPYHTLREVLAVQMHELSVDTGRELAAEPHAVDAPQLTTNVSTANACYGWQEMTDALAVRDMGRRDHQSRQGRSQSPSSSNARRSAERSRRRSRSRSRRRDGRQRSRSRSRSRGRQRRHDSDRSPKRRS
ncbi:hypothetical protein PINS_up014149 [Pythium insidiosum]|nr:hypothetical protein PINS_up014149 [Pythium insidiosum]